MTPEEYRSRTKDWRHDPVVSVLEVPTEEETTIGYALQRLEDTSIHMGDVERRLAKLHEETAENNELLEETFMVQKETTKPWRM